jgi:hypothetical protein
MCVTGVRLYSHYSKRTVDVKTERDLGNYIKEVMDGKLTSPT